MGLKQLRPLSNIYVKTDSPSNSMEATSSSNEDLIKYSKGNPIQSHRHSIITLLQPYTAGNTEWKHELTPTIRRNSENTLLLMPLSSAVVPPCQVPSPGPATKSQLNQNTNTNKEANNRLKKSQIPVKSRVPVSVGILASTETVGNKNLATQVPANSKNKIGLQNMKADKKLARSKLGALAIHTTNIYCSLMSTTADKTRLLMTTNPPITIITTEPDEESKPLICSDCDIVETYSGNNVNDLNHIFGNFIAATTPTGKSQEIIVSEFGIIDTAKCIDFGIYDFLSENYLKTFYQGNGDEVELDMSSDTDTSYLDASPPNRFSDSDLELLIEPLAISLETTLFTTSIIESPNPNQVFPSQNSISDDDQMGSPKQTKVIDNYRVINTKKPFRRNISLPATIFKLRLIGVGKTIDNYDNANSTGYARNRCSFRGSRLLSRLDSTSVSDIEKLELESFGYSVSDFSFLWSTRSFNLNSSENTSTGEKDEEFEEINDDNECVFSSDIEKRALNLRNVKRLYRQDTVGNFAPPDFCNT